MKKNRIGKWFKDHKKGLIITGLVVTGVGILVGAVVVANQMNGAGLEDTTLADSITDLVTKDTGSISDNLLQDDEQLDCSYSDTTIYNFNEEKKNIQTKAAHDVNGFVRKLHDGWTASPEKVAEAAEKGIILEENQTYVNPYKTGQKDTIA